MDGGSMGEVAELLVSRMEGHECRVEIDSIGLQV